MAAAPAASADTAGAAPLLAPAKPGKSGADRAAELVKAVTAKSAHRHLRRFQAIADSAGGNRAAGTLGHDASAAYVHQALKKAGYKVSYQDFEFTYTETLAERLAVLSPNELDVDVSAMTYTKSTPEGGLQAAVEAVPADNTTGCEAEDYAAGSFSGKIALIKRGGCTFAEKQDAAADAGAVAAIIYNDSEGALSGTLGDADAARIPTGGITAEDGEALAAAAAEGEVTVAYEIRQLLEPRTTRNVIAETRSGNPNRTVMLGAHLDSVIAGPGINDNGSGSAGLLEVALKLAELDKQPPRHTVRFAWWSAEELGLLGSEHYVEQLSGKERDRIALYLNFDMIASPNAAQFVYDGDDSDGVGEGPGPEGSAQLERDINRFLERRGEPYEGTDFNGRSDYGPFIAAGIPSGGTFTGAEGIKTEQQAAKYGGEAGVAYDPCYHAACDTLDNIDMRAFDLNIDVMANAVGTYGWDLSSLSDPAKSEPTRTEGSDGGGLASDHDRVSR
ncbi:M28 family metallopeptidase [Streptomyces sp. TP-A0874]|uniref:M28 family metallopeptidase n=1 Tax=Streptomyces sp. TP-A0874 TaxID=549819 RepID=UPI000D1A5D4D|nr:M28 family metallopeptidase [Streptomyces sp. TP-A0874]